MAIKETVSDIMPPQAHKDIALAREGFTRAATLGKSLSATYATIAQSYHQVRGRHTKQLNSVNIEAAKKIQPPSKTRYGSFIILSIAIDVFASPLVGAAWATVIGGVVATIALALCMWLAGWIFLGSQGKRAAQHREELQEQSRNLQRDIKIVEQEYRQFLRWLSEVAKRFPAAAARTTSLAARAGNAAKKYKLVRRVGKLVNWLKKDWVKQGSEAIPVWNLLPWWTIGAVAAYISHLGDWKESQDLLAQYNEGKGSVLAMTDTMYETRLAVISETAQLKDSYAQN